MSIDEAVLLALLGHRSEEVMQVISDEYERVVARKNPKPAEEPAAPTGEEGTT